MVLANDCSTHVYPTLRDSIVGCSLESDPEEEPEVVEERFAPYVEVMNTLTRSERIAVKALTDADVKDLLSQIELNGYLDLDDSDDQAVLTGLVSDSVISQASLDAINALR